MLFVTVGSQKFQFDRLIRAVDSLFAIGTITGDAFAQIGVCTYIPFNMKSEPFLARERFRKILNDSEVVITHGGTGAIITAVKAGKRVIAVPRLSKYGEHVDDHQVEIVSQFGEMGLIEPCIDLNTLSNAYKNVLSKNYRTYKSNTMHFCSELSRYIDEIGERQ